MTIADNQKIIISFVIPIYNAETYLEECLNSILQQDMDKNKYEIICINDGSTDNSLQLLENYRKLYHNIVVINKENGGVSSARNLGVKNAKGKWIWFVDSDDYIVNNCCSFLLEKAEEHNSEIVVFGGKNVNEYSNEEVLLDGAEITKCQGNENVLSLCPTEGYANGPFYYLFLKSKIDEYQLQFDSTMKYGEDTKFIFEYKFNCNSGLLIDLCFYCYRQNPSSAMHKLDAEAHAVCMYKLAELYNTYMEKCVDKEELYKRLKVARCRAVRNCLFDHCIYIRDYKRAKQMLAEVREKKWHPYKTRLGIYSKSLKGMLINIFNHILGVKWIYLLICKIRSKKQ